MIAIVGATGTVGHALLKHICDSNHRNNVITFGRDVSDDVYVDVCDSESYDNIDIQKTTELLGGVKLKAIVFCQGINPKCSLKQTSPSHVVAMYEANIVSTMMILRQLSCHHFIDDSAAIVMMGSVAARRGSFDPSYAAAKSAMEGLMHSLALAYKKQRFVIVSPGLIEGSRVHEEMLANAGSDYVKHRHASRMHGDRLISVDDVVSTTAMVIENKSIASTNIHVDGGICA